MSELDDLMVQAQKQLAEHVFWLHDEIKKMPADVGSEGVKAALCHQTTLITLRMVRADKGAVSVVWDYPDELGAFLRHPSTPQHLRDTLAGGHLVNSEQPAFTATRSYTDD